ncbi:hypothetical protein M728_005243 (plasmid) [Ensifer sp. WSM1721]|uniref:DUF5132 domain-containing protein n=1 Tax=Ensifer sp. WSM1721 TaxID=1041159 RepID=UPI0004BCABEA|nr:DUF5132 domain-containing protein [Ensifer sp. WSM1721]
MAILEDAFKGGNVLTGLAIGVGALVLAPVVTPLLRPVIKTVLKAGLVAYDQARVAYAEMNERASDLVAESRAEIAGSGTETAETGGGPRRPAERKTAATSSS